MAPLKQTWGRSSGRLESAKLRQHEKMTPTGVAVDVILVAVNR
jgi:hypothetical protein